MGAVFATEEVVAPIAAAGEVLMFFTYSAHPGCCAVADKVLEILEREALVERAAVMGEVLGSKLQALADHPNVAEIRGRGLLWALELVRDRDSLQPFPKQADLCNKVVAAGLSKGVFYYPGGCDPARDVITIGPPFTITEEQIDVLVGTLEYAISSAVDRVEAREGV